MAGYLTVYYIVYPYVVQEIRFVVHSNILSGKGKHV